MRWMHGFWCWEQCEYASWLEKTVCSWAGSTHFNTDDGEATIIKVDMRLEYCMTFMYTKRFCTIVIYHPHQCWSKEAFSILVNLDDAGGHLKRVPCLTKKMDFPYKSLSFDPALVVRIIHDLAGHTTLRSPCLASGNAMRGIVLRITSQTWLFCL